MSIRDLGGYAIVTGAASGIDQATAYALAEAGAAGILFADINSAGAAESASLSKEFATHKTYNAIAVQADVSDPGSVQKMVDIATREFPRVDYCVNSAGIVGDNAEIVADLDIAVFDRLHNVNARGTLLVTRAVLKAMTLQEERTFTSSRRHGSRNIGRGVIVNVGSLLPTIAMPRHLPYITSKHAVLGIVKASALYLAPHGIRVNGILPGFVNTPILAEAGKQILSVDAMAADNPFQRPAEPDEIADAIVFLCSPASSYVTGSGMVFDAGLGIRPITA